MVKFTAVFLMLGSISQAASLILQAVELPPILPVAPGLYGWLDLFTPINSFMGGYFLMRMNSMASDITRIDKGYHDAKDGLFADILRLLLERKKHGE